MRTTTLRQLVSAPGPFTSVYFEDSRDTADAGKQQELRWRELRERLAASEAPEETLNVLEDAVTNSEPPAGRGGRGLVAAGRSVLLDERLEEPPAQTLARVSALPYVIPLTRYAEPTPKYVLASVDQIGAEIHAFDGHGREVDTREVAGHEHPVHQVRGGGWSAYEIRQHQEETVRQNVQAVADDVTKVADRIGAELVVIAGEVQGRRAVAESLPKRWREMTQEVTHPDVASEVARSARQHRLDEVLNQFDDALNSRSGLAVDGLEAVTSALSEGNVETLLISDPGEATVTVGDNPTEIAVNSGELEALGRSGPRTRRADEAVPVAAIAGGSDLVFVDSSPAEGFGAILRHR